MIVERAIDALLTQVLKQKAGVTDKPRSRKLRISGRTRTIPVAIRREVWQRDQGRCTFVGVDGHRCNETRCLEFAHLTPWAKGGKHSASNIALRCQAHNAFEAARDYGVGFMASKRKGATKPLDVREPVARYVVRPPTDCPNCVATDRAESFFATRGKELLDGHLLVSRDHAAIAITDYIENYYNAHRAASYLDYVSPVE